MGDNKLFDKFSKELNTKNNPWRPVLLYGIFGFLWILFSDRILAVLVQNPVVYQQVQTIKGWLYVLITAGVLYFLIMIENRKVFDLNSELSEKTVELQAYVEETRAMDQELKDQLDRLNHMVYYDQLTGLRNRFSFEEDIDKLLKMGEAFNVYYVDVDHFKNLNDIHGHYFGDEFLKLFGYTLDLKFDKMQLYRWGGDEFVIIDPINKGRDMEEAVLGLLEMTHRTWHIKEVEFHTSTSIGAVVCPEQGSDLSTIFKNLEVALYKAKEAGRARCVFFDQAYLDIIQRKMDVESFINNALDHDGFTLNYQPIYDLETRGAYRYEILLRFNGANELNTHIGEVISVAEQTGQIHRIDDWVINKVFSEIAMQKKALEGFKVAINISAQSFTSPTFISYLKEKIEAYKVDTSLVEFEVTEHTIVKNINESYEIMKKIKNLGFMMALDDFGTRYSSLNYLSRLPFDILKIDKSYVDHILNEGNDLTIVKQIISLAKAIGLVTVAEGIETKEQEEILLEAGCDYGQGYHYSRPQPFRRLVEMYGDAEE